MNDYLRAEGKNVKELIKEQEPNGEKDFRRDMLYNSYQIP
jgi:hypothetical protein